MWLRYGLYRDVLRASSVKAANQGKPHTKARERRNGLDRDWTGAGLGKALWEQVSHEPHSVIGGEKAVIGFVPSRFYSGGEVSFQRLGPARERLRNVGEKPLAS